MSKFAAKCVLTACIFLVAGCLSTSMPRVDRGEVTSGLYDQRKLAVDFYLERLVKVNDLAILILRADNAICNDVAGHRIGVTLLSKRTPPPNPQQAA